MISKKYFMKKRNTFIRRVFVCTHVAQYNMRQGLCREKSILSRNIYLLHFFVCFSFQTSFKVRAFI
jgi:hypothetical protein